MTFADLHIHSSFSISTARDISVKKIEEGASRKGITMIASGDCLHPQWLSHLKEELKEGSGGGFYYTSRHGRTAFVLTTEVSLIFRRGSRSYRIHLIVLLENFHAVDCLISGIRTVAKLERDGRPIIKVDPIEFMGKYIDHERMIVIPAHIWTPWYSLFGSRSGFNSIKECFGDFSSEIYAFETGLSADPVMCGYVSSLDNLSLISNSDAHNIDSIGREFNQLPDIEAFGQLMGLLRNNQVEKSYEFFPQEGKYYFDGHRKCLYKSSPRNSLIKGDICPKCGKKIVRGVMSRVMELSDHKISSYRDFSYHIPLRQLVAFIEKKGEKSKKVENTYRELQKVFASEIELLHFTDISDIARYNEKLAEIIALMRNNGVEWIEGYDGEYGRIRDNGEEINGKDENP